MSLATHELLLLRHGESQWNKENRFTGWQDVGLSDRGREEALNAGKLLCEHKFKPNLVYTSVLKRAIHTLNSVLAQMDMDWIAVEKNWRLNERHYGALTGLNKKETAEKHSEEQVQIWRRSYSTPPPLIDFEDPRHPRFDLRYQGIDAKLLPRGESLKDTVERVKPFFAEWKNKILNSDGNTSTLIVAHGNSLRAMMMLLENISEKDIVEINLATAVPLYYRLEGVDLKVGEKKFFGDAAEIQAAMDKVKNQGKK